MKTPLHDQYVCTAYATPRESHNWSHTLSRRNKLRTLLGTDPAFLQRSFKRGPHWPRSLPAR